jgi:hypothetical protein
VQEEETFRIVDATVNPAGSNIEPGIVGLTLKDIDAKELYFAGLPGRSSDHLSRMGSLQPAYAVLRHGSLRSLRCVTQRKKGYRNDGGRMNDRNRF